MTPEFTYTRDYGRGRWVIWRHGQVYATVERSSKYPAHTETYMRRSVAILNGAEQ